MASDPQANEPQQVLSQDEVESLLSQVAQDQPPATSAAAGPGPTAPAPVVAPAPVRRYDFRPPSFLTSPELRQLRQRHEEFVRSLMTRLSIYLRLEFGARLVDLQTVPYRRVIDRLAPRTHLTLFRIETLNGMGLLDLPPTLGLALVDRLLGGPGQPANLEREFTEIEIEILDLVAQLVLKEWCQEVTHQPDAQPRIVSHESNPRFLQWSDPSTHMLQATFELQLNETAGELKLGLPSGMLEPLLGQLNAGLPVKPPESAPACPAPARWSARLDEVPVPLNAALTDLEITARELAHLRVGDVLQVAPQQANQVRVCVGQIPKFYGRLGTRDQVWAIELTGVL